MIAGEHIPKRVHTIYATLGLSLRLVKINYSAMISRLRLRRCYQLQVNNDLEDRGDRQYACVPDDGLAGEQCPYPAGGGREDRCPLQHVAEKIVRAGEVACICGIVSRVFYGRRPCQ